MEGANVQKQLYKSKAMATLTHYVSGNIYYKVDIEEGTYQFPISTVESNTETYYENVSELGEDDDFQEGEVEMMSLSSDLGTTTFHAEMKGSELYRWIAMAIKSDDFIKIN